MTTIKFERQQIEGVYAALERRLYRFILDEAPTPAEFRKERAAMMQGVYSVFSACASNWPEIRQWIAEGGGQTARKEC